MNVLQKIQILRALKSLKFSECNSLLCGIVLEPALKWLTSQFSYNIIIFYTFLSIRNLRFGCYRNLYFWIYGKRTAKKGFRQPLPACLVGLVKSRYPDPDNAYSGFIPSSGLLNHLKSWKTKTRFCRQKKGKCSGDWEEEEINHNMLVICVYKDCAYDFEYLL